MKKNAIHILIVCLISLSACSTLPIKDNNTKLSEHNPVEYELPKKLVEISALQKHDQHLFGLNDSGGEPEVYRIEKSKPVEIKQSIRLENAVNKDWESLALSDSLMFVGDFGNNLGTRKDLTIYYLPIDKITEASTLSVPSRQFSFFYPEQKEFKNHAYNHDYDMEAMVYHGKKLHLFTKEWKSNRTRHFTLDLVKGTQPAWLVEELELDFMVTGADIIRVNDHYTRLALVGYTKNGDVHMLITDFKTDAKKWLDNPKWKIQLGTASEVGQVEGVAFESPSEVCYSAEKITIENETKNQNLTCFSIKQ